MMKLMHASCAALMMLVSSRASADSVTPYETRSFMLPSGLKIVLAKANQSLVPSPRTYVGLYVASGWMEERRLGEAHFLEHLVANSQARVPIPQPPPGAAPLASNAVTKPNYTVFVRVSAPDTFESSIYSRLARAGQVDPTLEVFQHEQGRVIDELGRTDARYGAFKVAEAYARNLPVSLEDEKNSIRTAQFESLVEDIKSTYLPSRSTLVVAGDIDLNQTAAMVRRAASQLALNKPAAPARLLMTYRPTLHSKPITIFQNTDQSYAAGVSYLQPNHRKDEFYAFLILSHMLLGTQPTITCDRCANSGSEAMLPPLLRKSLGVTDVWDARDKSWGAPLFSDGNPSLYTIILKLRSSTDTGKIVAAEHAALATIRRQSMSDRQINTSRALIAAAYRDWLREPTFRIVSDHLAALAMNGRDPREVNRIPSQILSVPPRAVRQALDRLLAQRPQIVVTAPAQSSISRTTGDLP